MCFFSIYNKFKFKNWIKYSPGKRQKILEALEHKQAKKLKREELPVVINSDPNWNCYGMFTSDEKNNKNLVLSINLITRPELRYHALETILHEGRHAYQYEQITKKHIGIFNLKAKRWRDNYGGYITSAQDRLFYSLQPIERDAQKYSIKQMEKLNFKYRNEADYHETMNQMIYRFDSTPLKAKDQMGFFYKSKLNKQIKKNNK